MDQFGTEGAQHPHEPPAHSPIFNIARAVWLFIGVLISIHAIRVGILGSSLDQALLNNFGFSPVHYFRPDIEALRITADHDFTKKGPPIWSFASYAMIHSNWTHLFINCAWLVVFATPFVRRTGSARFILFCLGGAVAGALGHFVTHLTDHGTLIGASAIVSALMAGCCRFAFQDAGFAANFHIKAPPLPRLTIAATLKNRQARSFIIVWLIINILIALIMPHIAVFAHFGGFIFGLFFFGWFDGSISRNSHAGYQ